MASFTITVPDGKVQAVIDAFAKQYNYQETIPHPNDPNEQIPNPVSKGQFAKNILLSFVKEVYIVAQVKDLEATRQATITTAKAAVDDVTVG